MKRIWCSFRILLPVWEALIYQTKRLGELLRVFAPLRGLESLLPNSGATPLKSKRFVLRNCGDEQCFRVRCCNNLSIVRDMNKQFVDHHQNSPHLYTRFFATREWENFLRGRYCNLPIVSDVEQNTALLANKNTQFVTFRDTREFCRSVSVIRDVVALCRCLQRTICYCGRTFIAI